jgi:hypothetical protein
LRRCVGMSYSGVVGVVKEVAMFLAVMAGVVLVAMAVRGLYDYWAF